MSEIRTRPATAESRTGWERVWGRRKVKKGNQSQQRPTNGRAFVKTVTRAEAKAP